MPDPIEALRQALAERYVIERELGHGATATVYLAQDLRLPRKVALKVLHPELALAVRKERFQREIDIAARLTHPHILGLIESGTAGSFLYYVMPYLEGESLAERLEREGPLPVDEAVRIALEVADALSYAHQRDLIHRDIKPGNILLSSGHAWVADFGIARAIAASDARVTDTGVRVGTPAYMSPEQSSGAAELDGRTDLYSLGVVLYEMLAGRLPFTGPTIESLLVQQLMEPAPPLGVTRPDVPGTVAQAVARALAKNRGDRFESVAAFAAALSGKPLPAHSAPRRRPRAVSVGIAAGLAAVLIWGITSSAADDETTARVPAGVDSLRYVILPSDQAADSAPRVEELLHDAMGAWRGITVVDRHRVREALAARDSGTLSSRAALAVAIGLGAGRYVRGNASRIAGSLRIRAGLYDAMTGGVLVRERTATVRADLQGADSVMGWLAEQLLFGDSLSANLRPTPSGTFSFPARQALARGLAAVERWDLPAADTALAAATGFDADYAQAHLWLAQVRFWGGAGPATWRSAAERAAAGHARLSLLGAALVTALVEFGRGDLRQACAAWERLTESAQHEFAAWYGLANCLVKDDAVVRDPRSPSGWRFRTSYHQALAAYQRAFQLLPAIHASLSADGYGFVRRLLLTSGNDYRAGRALFPDTGRFAAYAAWRGDSLLLIPFPVQDVRAGRHWTIPAEAATAINGERERFHEVATAWATAFPQSADALEALAISLELLGDPTCLDTVRRAMTLTNDPSQRLRIASNAVWMQLKFAIPSDVPAMRAARRLADSLLRTPDLAAPGDALLLASLAVLRGHARDAATLSQRTGTRRVDLPPSERTPPMLAAPGRALLAYASLGGPADSLDALERRVESAIEQVLTASLRRAAELEWLARPASLAFPQHRLRAITRLEGRGDYLVDAQAAFLRGDSTTVRRIFADVSEARRHNAPADLTLDGLYPEAWLLTGLGDYRAASAWLDPTLEALPGTAPQIFADPARAGALVRAIVLRADLAHRLGDDQAARRWARVVTILWSDADAFLAPTVQRMALLAR